MEKMPSESDLITVYIIAASAIVRAGLEAVLQTDERLVIVGGAADISAAPSNFAVGQRIDVTLVNVERQREFITLTDFLSGGDDEDKNSSSVVALLSEDFQNLEQIIGLLKNGVRGILPREATAGEIGSAIVAAANNLIAAPPEILEMIVSSISIQDFSPETEKQSPTEWLESLTPREQEVLELLVEGESNKAIALHLNISEHTVKFHVASIFGKLGVNTRTEAVMQALRRGLVLL
jgi:two-component system, NarL family, response regulator YdfI